MSENPEPVEPDVEMTKWMLDTAACVMLLSHNRDSVVENPDQWAGPIMKSMTMLDENMPDGLKAAAAVWAQNYMDQVERTRSFLEENGIDPNSL